MPRKTPEQDLVDAFDAELHNHQDSHLRIETLINQNCKAKKYSDIEYISVSKTHWVIEAKSNDSGDAHNSVHKIFGELLKETGRDDRANCNFAILIPEASLNFYSRAFQSINSKKFIDFGKLIPVHTVFTFSSSGIGRGSWGELYSYHAPNK